MQTTVVNEWAQAAKYSSHGIPGIYARMKSPPPPHQQGIRRGIYSNPPLASVIPLYPPTYLFIQLSYYPYTVQKLYPSSYLFIQLSYYPYTVQKSLPLCLPLYPAVLTISHYSEISTHLPTSLSSCPYYPYTVQKSSPLRLPLYPAVLQSLHCSQIYISLPTSLSSYPYYRYTVHKST